MARRRAAGDGDLREAYLGFLLRSYETKYRPERMAPRIAAVRAGAPFVASGWQLGHHLDMHTNYIVETNGNVIEAQDVVRDGAHHYLRPDGTEVNEC